MTEAMKNPRREPSHNVQKEGAEEKNHKKKKSEGEPAKKDGDKKEQSHALTKWEAPSAPALVEGVKKKTQEYAVVLHKRYVEGTALEKHVANIDKFVQFVVKPDYETHNEAIGAARSPIRFGSWIFLLFFVVLGGWAACAPLDSAAVAPGTVVLDANKKTIQHFEGGIVAELLVKEGSAVKAGDPLVRLDDTTARARRDILQKQLWSAWAKEARLMAERDGKEEIVFPEVLISNQDNVEIAGIIDAQKRLFDSRRKAVQGQVDVLTQTMRQSEDEIEGLRAQVDSATRQLELINEEIGAVDKLLEAGHAQKPRLLALQRQAAELEGNRGEFKALIARAEQRIAQSDMEILNIKNQMLNEVVALLGEEQEKIADLEERLRAANDVLNRIVINAPQSGIVSDLQFHTIGGVIQAGAKIMDIVPQDDELVIEAMVSPGDIDVVHEGLEARVRMSAYKVRTVPMLNGKVTHVSPDRFVDEATGQAFYLARIKINEEMLDELKNVELYPGMPADVLIVTGERTVLSYMFDPITDHILRAFREQ